MNVIDPSDIAVGERIRTIRKSLGLTQPQLAARVGVSRGAVGNWELGKGVKRENLRRIAEEFDISFDWLATGRGDVPVGDEPAPEPDHPPLYSGNLSAGMVEIEGEDWISVGRYDARLSAGAGSLLDTHPEPLGHALFEAQWLREVTRAAPSQLALVRVDGDSMIPTFQDGDWVMVDRSQARFDREGVYALRVGEAAWIKRLSLNLREKLIRIISDNPAYPQQELEEHEVSLIGRVVWIVGRKV